MRSIYLDHAATTPTDMSVIEEMLPYMSPGIARRIRSTTGYSR